MKDEIDLNSCTEFSEVNVAIDDWMGYCNNERCQWQLAKLSPNEYYQFLIIGNYPLPTNNPPSVSDFIPEMDAAD